MDIQMMLRQLTPTQKRAFKKLLNSQEQESAYSLQESLSTLNSLVKKGLITKKVLLGSSFSPRTSILFRSSFRIE